MLRVDLVVGGLYGDEGKGQVALWLADHNKYNAHVRTGGENAEHRITDREGAEHTFHILPSASMSQNRAPLLLPAGMTFSLDGLLREVEYVTETARAEVGPVPGPWKEGPETVVDRNAAIITYALRKSGEEAAKKRGSTFLGVGATMAAKTARAGGCSTAKDHIDMLGDIGVQVGNVASWLRTHDRDQGYDEDFPVLIEASQGAMLSLDHGHYPFCTSRNVTATGALSDTGLNWRDVRRVVMVIKALPTRVPGPSGPAAGQELTWEAACRRAGRPYEEIAQTSSGDDPAAGPGAGGKERPFELSMDEVEYAAGLCGPTSVVLTFIDWYDYTCNGAKQQRHLTPKVNRLIHRVEEAAGAPVMYVRTGPAYGDLVHMRPGLVAR